MNEDINENIEENIIGFDALYRSMEKCRKGVIWKDSVAHYYLNAIEETLKLEKQLKTGTYKERKPVQFTIMAPKKREIVSIAFRDRVYQRSLNDNAIYPQMTKGFINTNVACQKGKGTDIAREILKEYLRAMYRKCGKNFSVLQCDIHGYYPNMQHETARQTFRKGLEPHIYKRDNFSLTEKSRKTRFTRVTEVVESCQMCWKLHRMQHTCNRNATNISMICIGHFQSNLGMSFSVKSY